MPWPFFSAFQCPAPSCKLCLFYLCTVLQHVNGQRKSLSTPGLIFFPLLTHSFHQETAPLGLDYCSLDFQLATFTHQVHHQPPGSCQCSSRCTGCPRCARPAGRLRWHWPGTANTRGDTWDGAGLWHSFAFILLQPTPCVWFLWSMLMLNCHG